MAKNENGKFDINELIEKGKQKGSLTNSEVLEAIEEADLDVDGIEKVYESLEQSGIEVTGYLDDIPELEDITAEVENYETPESMEKILSSEGLAIEDHVRIRAGTAARLRKGNTAGRAHSCRRRIRKAGAG